MKTERHNGTLSISEIPELASSNSGWFCDEVRASLDEQLKTIEIDLSKTDFVDSSGLGALVLLHKAARGLGGHGATIRLLNPIPRVQQIFELTRMHHLFEIVRR